ncbi:MAG: 2-amino-4-hydroxy-6-hydroxymethyldihydropteridine diphosphokinase [Desulfovibrio sp.]|jgi:2-amino-4-hydroxy-6-hydroxymethyldihydropteridine diphosphokinase|nr:2-amino-4-hydroxy-6-hydroxymethyldihydropteridine diphosphokinase [Desulfovibrio sp.]
MKTFPAREHIRAYVCLGSNCKEAEAILARTRLRLEHLPDMRPGAVSPLYHTEPQGYRQQPWFLNQVMELLPGQSWSPERLLRRLLRIERELGRQRTPATARFGPRVIDADLLLYGETRSTRPECLLPHPRMKERAFVLVPLLDTAPDICIDGVRADVLLAGLNYRVEKRCIFQ